MTEPERRPTIVVAGLGPAGPELITPAALAAIEACPVRFLRTTRHPAAVVVEGADSFDEVYDDADTFDDVYATIAERLVAAAAEAGRIVYVVPGSPLVLERTVERLRRDERVVVELVASMSFLDVAWARLGVDPVEASVRLVDGHTFATAAAGERGPLLVAHCHNRRVLSDIKLAVDDPGDATVTILQRLGGPDEAITTVAWADLDRSVEPDHLTSLWIPELASPVGAELVRFDELVRTLRRECPWDSTQTHASLRRHLVEETYELLEAIDGYDPETGDGAEDLEEELGDLLFQVVLHAAMGAEAGWFELADVARTVHDKLYERHPHVFGGEAVASTDELVSAWEARKLVEKDRESVFDGVPMALPSLALAEKVLKKATVLGLGDLVLADDVAGEDTGATAADEAESALGRELFALVEEARRGGVDAEMALRNRARVVVAQVRAVERLAAESDIDVISATQATIDDLWARATGKSGTIPS